jgi:hypothetical protein
MVWSEKTEWAWLQRVFAYLNLLATLVQFGLNTYQLKGMGPIFFTRFWNLVEVAYVIFNSILAVL